MNNMRFKILSFIMMTFFMCYSEISSAQSFSHNCKNPLNYGLELSDLSLSNSDYYCWEIKYLKEYHDTNSIAMSSYYSFFPNNISGTNIALLRQKGITPEKADYLYKYFVDEKSGEYNYEKQIDAAISKAKNEIQNKSQYAYGKPIWVVRDFSPPILNIPPLNIETGYEKFLKVFGADCLPITYNKKSFDIFPESLRPAGIIDNYVINAFGEVVAEIKDISTNGNISKEIFIIGENNSVTRWDNKKCPLSNLEKRIENAASCISCTMFEIAFNTVSRIAFVLYDKLSRYVLDLMVVLFLLWSLYIFFENAIKKNDGFSFVNTFFNKAMWVFIVAAFLSVSITDKNNIVNYSIRPLTDFLTGYNQVMTKAIDKTDKPFECKYKSKNKLDNNALFSNEIKENIVCTIERVIVFSTFNIVIGENKVKQGGREILNLEFSSGLIKIFLGLIIMGMFFIFILTVPFLFIETLFKISVFVFLLPVFLMAYAFDKGKGFVMEGFNQFLSGIFQLVSLSIMISVISLLMMYISNLDFYGLNAAIENNNAQEMVSQLLLIMSFNTNKLLEIFYTSIICFYFMGQALTIANKYGGSESFQKTFFNWTKSGVKWATTVVREKFDLKVEAGAISNKIEREKEKRSLKEQAENKKEELKQKEPEENNNV